MGKILDIIEENGDTLVETGKMFFQKRPELIELVQDLGKSYISLAHKYEQLKSKSTLVKSTASDLGCSFSNSSFIHQHQHQHIWMGSGDELNENGFGLDELELEIPKMVEDSLSPQAELIKRIEEKRVVKELEMQINELMEENKMLKGTLQAAHQEHSCSCDKNAKKQPKKSSSFSKLKGALHLGRKTDQ
ncbi:hypothetical protein LIER_17730 [Lithospermum erythrorhizon]|uniref:NAB domain-containing protein n=1 Tax=Lithospermum erythrorhizon TaxID=34254 RepID=A0AAV3QFK2_LITER